MAGDLHEEHHLWYVLCSRNLSAGAWALCLLVMGIGCKKGDKMSDISESQLDLCLRSSLQG